MAVRCGEGLLKQTVKLASYGHSTRLTAVPRRDDHYNYVGDRMLQQPLEKDARRLSNELSLIS
jgi:hypothetical protein